MLKKILSLAIVFLIALSWVRIPPLAYAQSSWYDSNWLYRKPLTINCSSAGAQTDYPVEIHVSQDDYDDFGKYVYVDSKARSDFGDIRFTNNDTVTLLDYWLEDNVTDLSRFSDFSKTEYTDYFADIPDYAGDGVVHPDTIYFESGMDGYKYWMVYTPYPDPVDEHPSIVRSNDGLNWTDTGISNPVIDTGNYDSDPDFIYVSSLSKWFMVWAIQIGSNLTLALAYSSDGKSWTEYDGVAINGNTNPDILTGVDDDGQSWERDGGNSKVLQPSLMYEEGVFYLWYADDVISGNQGKVGLATFTWNNTTDDIENFQRNAGNPIIDLSADSTYKSGQGHINVVKHNSTYYMYAVRQILASANMQLVMLTSENKTDWTDQGTVVSRSLSLARWDYQHIYRSSLLVDDNGEVAFINGTGRLYVSAYLSNIPRIGLFISEGNHARFHVEVDNIYACPTQTTIYMYYGNSGASTTSSGSDTAMFFDDFNSYSDGGLNGQGGWVANSQFEVQTSVTYEGAKAIYLNSTGNNLQAEHNFTASPDGRILVRMRPTATNKQMYTNIEESAGGPPNSLILLRFSNSPTVIDTYNGVTYIPMESYTSNTWYRIEMKWRGSDDKASIHADLKEYWTPWAVGTGGWTNIEYVKFQGSATALSMTCYWDYLAVMKIVYPEPVLSDWGAEETEAEIYVYITATFHTGISSMAYNTTNLANNTATAILNETNAIFDSNITDGYVFFRYELPESEDNHTHYQTYTRTMTANYSIIAFALETGGGGSDYSGVGFIIVGIVAAFLAVLVLASRKR